jgi:AraC-like DNA-binding protein
MSDVKGATIKQTVLTMETPNIELEYRIVEPEPVLSEFVERFYMIKNQSLYDKEVVLIPDGRVDLFFLITEANQFIVTLIGLETQPTTAYFPSKCAFFGVSLKLLSIEYLLNTCIADIVNSARKLTTGFWNITHDDLNDFDSFYSKISCQIKESIQPDIDGRKQRLFDIIYETNGSLQVKEYAERAFWTERQINRYFSKYFGISLKVFCNILRFKASFQHLKNGNLFPEQAFSDQAHFIREVKKLTKVTPKVLAKNKNDRFVQFSTLPPK